MRARLPARRPAASWADRDCWSWAAAAPTCWIPWTAPSRSPATSAPRCCGCAPAGPGPTGSSPSASASPSPAAAFDGLYSINVLEHVADLAAVLAESARVLVEGGTFLAITPNGDWEALLDLAERWRLKIPEGPHAFLTPRRLAEAVRRHFAVIEHRTFLVLPAGPPALTALVDRATAAATLGWGFFQYLVARKPDAAPAARP